MNVETNQQYQETVELYANVIFQLKQRYDKLSIYIVLCQIKKLRNDMDLPDVEDLVHVSSYPILEYMGFDTGIYDGFAKMRAATILGDILRLHKFTENILKYVQKPQSMGILLQYQILPPSNCFKELKGTTHELKNDAPFVRW